MKVGVVFDGVDNLVVLVVSGDLLVVIVILNEVGLGFEGRVMFEIIYDLVFGV